MIYEFDYNGTIGFTENISKELTDGNGYDTIAYTRKQDGSLEMWDAYIVIDNRVENYVDLCKWYDADGFEVPRFSDNAECVAVAHCPIG